MSDESVMPQSGFLGTWDVTIATPIGKIETLFEITTTESGLAGIACSNNETVVFVDPVIVNDHMTWTQRVTKPMRLNLAFDIELDGDRFSGTAKAGRLPASRVIGQRQNSSA